jgi:LysM repeat protein/predicted nucleic acid-binding Zn ribbon protein
VDRECVNCGTRLPSGVTRCPVCGVFAPAGHKQRRCPNCGTPVAQQAQTCLMCDAPLDPEPGRDGLASVSWQWMGAIALIAALIVVGWSRWSNQPQPAASVPRATPNPTITPTPMPAATPTPIPSATPSPVPSPTPIIHVVQSGETIIYIASYYGTTAESIMKANGLDETLARMLRPGQELLIPSTGPVGGPVPGAAALPPQVIHEVASGETLSSIADDYDTNVEAIMAANNLDSPDLIYVGQELVVPLMPPTATSTPTPTPTPTTTPAPPYPAPDLLSPAEDAVLEGEGAVILLTWTSVGILRDNQAYLVELKMPARTDPVTYTTQGTSWRLPSDLWPTGRHRTLSWWVTVVQQTGSTSGGSADWEPLSPPAAVRHFEWR